MSDLSTHDLPLPRAKDIKARAAAWLERKDSGDWTGKDQLELEAWLAESNANLIAYRRVSEVWGRTERLAALRPPSNNRAVLPKRSNKGPLVFRALMGVAALALLGVIGATTWRPSEAQSYTTAVGGRDILSLPDGSRIELNTDSSVRVSDAPNERKVWLDRGEAYFQVVHDASRPFVVIAGNRRVTDIGTKFVMRREPGKLQLSVVDGKVQFESGEDKSQARSAVLGAGDTVTATANAVVVKRKSTAELTNELSWRQGVFVFRRTTLEDAAQQYNRYNRLKIAITDPEIAKLTISGTLPTNNVEAFVGVARNFFSIEVEHRDGEIVLSRAAPQVRTKHAH